MARISKREQEEARTQLREWLPPGSTVYTVLRHVSRSGMMRAIDVYAFVPDDNGLPCKLWLSRLVSKLTYSFSEKYEAIRADGCGMDMGYSIVNNLGYALYPDGFECTGENGHGQNRCPSNDHSNGDRDYTPHEHKSGGYAFHHEWI